MTNKEIKDLVSQTCHMDRCDRMTVDLLNNYAFVLHENVNDLTDEEINTARSFADNYLKKHFKWDCYSEEIELFVNRQCFKAMTNNDYEELEKLIYQIVKEANDIVNIYDWELDIYYSADYENKLILSRINKDVYQEKIDLIYDIENRTFSSCDIPLSDEMDKLGTINYNSYTFYELYNVRI